MNTISQVCHMIAGHQPPVRYQSEAQSVQLQNPTEEVISNAALIRISLSSNDTHLLNSASYQPYFKIITNQSGLSAAGNSIGPSQVL